jgi:hypothetical protein
MAHFELISFAGALELAQAAASAWLDKVGTPNRQGQPQSVHFPAAASPGLYFNTVAEILARKAAP